MSLLLLILFGLQTPADLNAVIERATAYVSQYETELGNLIGTEEYVQNSTLLDNSTPPRVSKRTQRRTSSDFLIIQVGTEWQALRKVNRLDGIKVKQTTPSFEDVFDDSPEANAKRLRDMTKDSTEYNLGDVIRQINLPTFALKVLRKGEVSRFSFERAGTAKINGTETWKVRYRERTGRSLVSGAKGENLYSTGMIWVDPENGRVLQTEFEVENPYAVTLVKARMVVTYGPDKKLPILVPTVMVETYESKFNTIDCRAEYSNFRPFEVDVKFEIATPKP